MTHAHAAAEQQLVSYPRRVADARLPECPPNTVSTFHAHQPLQHCVTRHQIEGSNSVDRQDSRTGIHICDVRNTFTLGSRPQRILEGDCGLFCRQCTLIRHCPSNQSSENIDDHNPSDTCSVDTHDAWAKEQKRAERTRLHNSLVADDAIPQFCSVRSNAFAWAAVGLFRWIAQRSVLTWGLVRSFCALPR